MAVVRSTEPPLQTEHAFAGVAPATDAFTKKLRGTTHDARHAMRARHALTQSERTVAREGDNGTTVVRLSRQQLDADRFGTLRDSLDLQRSGDVPSKRSTRMAATAPGRQAMTLASSGTMSAARPARSTTHQQLDRLGR